MKPTIPVFAVLAAIALAVPLSHAQTLTGAQAQKSPQAEVFLAYEKGLIAQGMDGARPHMTPEKLEDLKSMVKHFGEEGFKQFQDKMRGGAHERTIREFKMRDGQITVGEPLRDYRGVLTGVPEKNRPSP